MYKLLYGHVSFETAAVAENYPYGKLRTEMKYWVETRTGFGQRLVTCSLNPKTKKWNKPHAGGYSVRIWLFRDEHLHGFGLGGYNVPQRIAVLRASGLFDQMSVEDKLWCEAFLNIYRKRNPESWGEWEKQLLKVMECVKEKGRDVEYATSGQNDQTSSDWVYQQDWKPAAALAKHMLFGVIVPLEGLR